MYFPLTIINDSICAKKRIICGETLIIIGLEYLPFKFYFKSRKNRGGEKKK